MALNSPEARDLAHHLHSFTHLPSLERDGPLVLERGEGIYVHDIHGKRYLESVSGLWNIVAGFSEPRLVRAAHEAMQQMPAYHTFFGRTALPPIALAEKLVEIAPMEVSRVYFVNSGSEANDSTIKMLWMMARGAGEPERRKLISRYMAYHGTTVASCSLNGKPYIGAFGLPMPEVRYVEAPHYWRNAHPGESEEAYAEPPRGRAGAADRVRRRRDLRRFLRRARDGRRRCGTAASRLFPEDSGGAQPPRNSHGCRRGGHRSRPHREPVGR